MTIADLRTLLHRHRHPNDQVTDPHGFGFSRDTTRAAVAVPDGVDLYFFTGRTPREATR
jgi:hypothetical protein